MPFLDTESPATEGGVFLDDTPMGGRFLDDDAPAVEALQPQVNSLAPTIDMGWNGRQPPASEPDVSGIPTLVNIEDTLIRPDSSLGPQAMSPAPTQPDITGPDARMQQPLTQEQADAGNKAAWEAARSAELIPRIQVKPDDNPYLAVGKEIVNLGSGFVNFATGPLGPAAALSGGVAPTATAALFTADMLYGLGKEALDTYGNWFQMTPAEKAAAITRLSGTGLMAGLTGAHTIKGVKGGVASIKSGIKDAAIRQLPDVDGRFLEPTERAGIAESSSEPRPGTPLETKPSNPTRETTPAAPVAPVAAAVVPPKPSQGFNSITEESVALMRLDEANQLSPEQKTRLAEIKTFDASNKAARLAAMRASFGAAAATGATPVTPATPAKPLTGLAKAKARLAELQAAKEKPAEETAAKEADIAKMSPAELQKKIISDQKATGISMTRQSYEIGRKITKDDLPALEKAEQAAAAQNRAAMKESPVNFDAAMAAATKKQFLNEIIRYRKVQDMVNERGITDAAELEAFGKQNGVGELSPAKGKEVSPSSPAVAGTETAKPETPSQRIDPATTTETAPLTGLAKATVDRTYLDLAEKGSQRVDPLAMSEVTTTRNSDGSTRMSIAGRGAVQTPVTVEAASQAISKMLGGRTKGNIKLINDPSVGHAGWVNFRPGERPEITVNLAHHASADWVAATVRHELIHPVIERPNFAKYRAHMESLVTEELKGANAFKLYPTDAAKLNEASLFLVEKLFQKHAQESTFQRGLNQVRLAVKRLFGVDLTSREVALHLVNRALKNKKVPSGARVGEIEALGEPATAFAHEPIKGLDDIYKIFEPPPKTGATIGQRATQIAEAVRTGFSSKFRPLDKLAQDIAKAYGTVSQKGIAGIFEQLKGSSGRGEAMVYRFDQDVSSLVKGAEKDFNAYMFLRRSLDRFEQDAASGEGRRKVAGYDPKTLQDKLALLESSLGKEGLSRFRQASDLYQQHMDSALKLQVESGRMSQEVYDLIKDGNQFYAPFKVMKYIEETSRPAGTGRRIDTTADFTKAMSGIEDPNFKLGDMLGAARQSLLLSRILADKNNAMRRVAELSAFDTEGQFIKRLGANEEAPRGWEAVNVFEEGKQARYATNPDVAAAIQIYGETGGGIISRTLSAFSIPFRAGATALNLPFQVSNLMADVPRQALVSKYGVRGAADLIRYPLDFVHAMYSSISGDVFGAKNKLFLDFLDSGVAGATVQEHLTPKALRTTTSSTAKTVGRNILWSIPNFAQAIEQTSKILGVKRAMRFEGAKSGAELARQVPAAITELRRFSGSPDFGRQGKWTEQARLNLLYMFFNARVQGAVADIGRLTGRDGAGRAASTWLKVGTAVGLPTVYLYLLNNSDEYKDDFAQRNDNEKNNYWLIPKDTFITNESGERMRDYWRIPKRESAKWIANLSESALNFARQRDPETLKQWAVKMLEDISPVNIQGNTFQERSESVAASLNPVLKAPLEAATGRDLYRHRDIVPDSQKKASPEQQYTDRTAEAFKKLADAMPDVAPEVFRSPLMLENMTKNLTAGLLTQFLPGKPIQGRSTLENQALLQRFQAAPYTDQSKFREELGGLQREAADDYLKRHRAAMKLMSDNKGKDLKLIVQGAGKDVKLIRQVVDLWLAEKNGITPAERQLLALPTAQRAEFLAGKFKGMTPEQKKTAITNYARKRILTEAVAGQMADSLK